MLSHCNHFECCQPERQAGLGHKARHDMCHNQLFISVITVHPTVSCCLRLIIRHRSGQLYLSLRPCRLLLQHKLNLTLQEYRTMHKQNTGGQLPHNKLLYPESLRYLSIWVLGIPMRLFLPIKHTYKSYCESYMSSCYKLQHFPAVLLPVLSPRVCTQGACNFFHHEC